MVENQSDEVGYWLKEEGIEEIAKRWNRASYGEGNDGVDVGVGREIGEAHRREKNVADLGREGVEEGFLDGGRRAVGRDGESDGTVWFDGEEVFGELEKRD